MATKRPEWALAIALLVVLPFAVGWSASYAESLSPVDNMLFLLVTRFLATLLIPLGVYALFQHFGAALFVTLLGLGLDSWKEADQALERLGGTSIFSSMLLQAFLWPMPFLLSIALMALWSNYRRSRQLS